jgi:hypothetical protein
MGAVIPFFAFAPEVRTILYTEVDPIFETAIGRF